MTQRSPRRTPLAFRSPTRKRTRFASPVSSHGRHEQWKQYHSSFETSFGASGSRITVRSSLMNRVGDS
jgi:hypothetical protein